jgi:hypothetical protein
MAGVDALECLQRSIQALALPADLQLALFPSIVVVADELAEEYHFRLQLFLGPDPSRLAFEHGKDLCELRDFLQAMSGSENRHLWTMEALQADAHWGRIREMARAVLTLSGWPLESPDLSHNVYIPSARKPHA